MRPVRISDYQFIYECYQDWPLGPLGPVTLDTAVRWARRWSNRDDEKVLVLDVDGPVGLIKWRQNWILAKVDNIIVHPNHRGKGHSKTMIQELHSKLTKEGVMVAEFDALPGPISDMTLKGRFKKTDEKTGETGLPLVVGTMTWDMSL